MHRCTRLLTSFSPHTALPTEAGHSSVGIHQCQGYSNLAAPIARSIVAVCDSYTHSAPISRPRSLTQTITAGAATRYHCGAAGSPQSSRSCSRSTCDAYTGHARVWVSHERCKRFKRSMPTTLPIDRIRSASVASNARRYVFKHIDEQVLCKIES